MLIDFKVGEHQKEKNNRVIPKRGKGGAARGTKYGAGKIFLYLMKPTRIKISATIIVQIQQHQNRWHNPPPQTIGKYWSQATQNFLCIKVIFSKFIFFICSGIICNILLGKFSSWTTNMRPICARRHARWNIIVCHTRLFWTYIIWCQLTHSHACWRHLWHAHTNFRIFVTRS